MTVNEAASLTSSIVEAEAEDADDTADLASQAETNDFSTSDDRRGRSEDDGAGDHAGDDAEDDAEDDTEDDADRVRNPGVRLVGRRVRKLYATPSEPEGWKLYTGTVLGSRVDKTWGTVYGVRYEDGDEQEVIYEEIISMLDEPDVKHGAVPLSVVQASSKARSSWAVEKHFPRREKTKGKRRTWVGVRRDAEFEDAFYGVATDPRMNVEHHFDIIFSTRHAAGAAHDLLVRRMHAVAANEKKFLGWEAGAHFDAGPAGPRAKTRYENALDFEALNFQDASWSDLCGIVLGGVATTLTRVVRENAHAPLMKRGPCFAPPPLPPPPSTKRKKRDPKAPFRKNVDGRVYDSQLGVTCHWCRQKTHEAHVTCTSPTCAPKGSRLAVSFCGPCLRNRNGEDVFLARESGRWICPRCRGSCGPGCVTCCNCGPCRIAAGLKPTGPGVAHAFAAGFGNVHDFLVGRETGEGREAVARRKLDFAWGAWLAPRKEAPPAPAATSPATLPMPPTTPTTRTTPTRPTTAAAPTTPTTPITPSAPITPMLPLAEAPRRGFAVPAAAGASAAVADLRLALGDAKAMVAEGLLDDQDFGKVKASVLTRIALGAGGGASSAGA